MGNQPSLVGRRITYVDWLTYPLTDTGEPSNVLMSLHLDDGSIINVDATEAAPFPVVTFTVEQPKRKLPRLCHGCGAKLDRYLPSHVCFCGACGEPRKD